MKKPHLQSTTDMLLRAFLTTFLTTVAVAVARKVAHALTESHEEVRPKRKLAKVRRVVRHLPESLNVPHRVSATS